MASKWTALKGKYPASPLSNMTNAADQRYIEKVDRAKEAYVGCTLQQLLGHLAEMDANKDELNEQLKEVNVRLEALGQLIITKFEEQDLHSVKTNAGKTVYLNVEPYVGMAERERVEQYISTHPDLDYLWSIHPQTLATLVKGYLEQGQDEQIPPGLKIFLKTSVRLRKS